MTWIPLTDDMRSKIEDIDNSDASVSEWEGKFLESMMKIIDDPHAQVSDKQAKTIDDMAKKYL